MFSELAAKHFSEPLSRLWYVANMMSLYYAHYDDMRFGYLWSEYRTKMRYELFALKHLKMAEKNRESGQKGGQADKKSRTVRYSKPLGPTKIQGNRFRVGSGVRSVSKTHG